jgi:S-adenosylmethionine:tRNA ribosyltransferase-isomerase
MYALSDYDYDLPPERIAQAPASCRTDARLLVLGRRTGVTAHRTFGDLLDYLRRPDLLVINDTEVIPGRLIGRKASGGRVEVLILDYAGGRSEGDRFFCRCLVKAAKPPRPGTLLFFDDALAAEVLAGSAGIFTLRFDFTGSFDDHLYRIGRVPLPPYIRRGAVDPLPSDRYDYQTVYAGQKGAVAAPTAGLHFSNELLSAIRAQGTDIVTVTLHVGYGTFEPVRVDDIRAHRMHAERYHLSVQAAERINGARARGGRIVAVGTTCVRTLEFCADAGGRVTGGSGTCNLFIVPGYRFKAVDGLITNFHLPKSTLLMLVAAFAGKKPVLDAYAEAIREKYRFFSYGDAMLIL